MNAEQFVQLVKDTARQVVRETLQSQAIDRRLGEIDPAYAAGLPKVIFDGEEDVSDKTYPHLASYTPAAGDRVELLLFGSTWVIQGRVVS